MPGRLESPGQYIKETEPAVKNLFDSLERYFSILKKIKLPTFISPLNISEEQADEAFGKWQKKNRPAIKRGLQRQRKYFGYQFSIATLNGSILQIAHMGIALFSENKVVPPDFSSVIRAGSKEARFCIGRRVQEVPVGLIIYAGRNQYNHMGEPTLNRLNTFIFDTLATRHGIKGAENIKDPAFDLSNRRILIYSSNLLSILGWHNYDPYLTDMKCLLGT
jgi:hypothetical protein